MKIILPVILPALFLALGAFAQDGDDGACDDTFADFSECTVQSITNCRNCDATPGPGLTPGDCSGFAEWSGTNKNCCDNNECSAQFNAFASCKGCSAEGEPEPKPETESGGLSSECTTCLMDPTANCEAICATGAEGEIEPTMSGCSEAMAANTQCLVQNCPDFDLQCDAGFDADTCDDVQMMCNNLADCCGACGDELVVVLSGCTPGDGGTCKISTCGTGAAPEEPPAEEPQEPEETEPEESEPEDEEPGSSCSTAISAAGLVAISFFAAMVNGV